MAVPKSLLSHQTSGSAAGDEEHSVVTCSSSPRQQQCLPLKKRKFDSVQEDGTPSQRDRASSPESDSSTTHQQPLYEDLDSATSSKKPRVEKGFTMNYVMSRAFTAPTPASRIDFMQVKSKQQGTHDFKCKICNKSFPTHQALGGHVSNHYYKRANHILDPSSTTNVTETSSSTSNDYTMPVPLMIESVNSQQHVQYKFKCKTCNKSFLTHRALGGHRSSHYGEIKDKNSSLTTNNEDGIPTIARDHRCNICNQSFPTGRALGRHKQLHWVKPSSVQASTAKSLSKGEISCKKMFDFGVNEHRIGGDEEINLELTL